MGWSDLPLDLLLLIAGTLTEFTDKIRLRCVCSDWRSAFRSLLPLPPQLPWLLLPSPSTTSSDRLYSFSEDRIYRLPLPLSEARFTFLFGSCSGWLLAFKRIDYITCIFSLVNPFTGASIALPQGESYVSYVENNPLVWDHSDSIVVVGGYKGVFYCHIGQNKKCHPGKYSWKQIDFLKNIKARSIVSYKSKFYILDAHTSKIFVLEGEPLEIVHVINPPDLVRSQIRSRLFVSSRESLAFLNSCAGPRHETFDYFKVYQMGLKEEIGEWRWREDNDVGDCAIFLDNLRCFSVDLVGVRSKLRRNCVYVIQERKGGFTRQYSVSEFKLGSMKGRQVRKFVVAHPPTWILPSLD